MEKRDVIEKKNPTVTEMLTKIEGERLGIRFGNRYTIRLDE